MSCLFPKEWGCVSGVMDGAMQYLEKTGLVTESCFPYTSEAKEIEKCRTTCVNATEPFKRYKCRAKSTKILTDERSIKEVLFTSGPVTATFDVYEDFFNYRKGIYKYTTGAFVGYHAVKIIGWGYDWWTDSNYYICQNSWDIDWGQKGYFFIRVGECNIDKEAYYCDPVI